MTEFPIFLSIVFVVRNRSDDIEDILSQAAGAIEARVSDYELIVIDNGSDDDTVSTMQRLTGETGLANLQLYALTKQIETDAAAWVGIENALGDFVGVLDPLTDDIDFLPAMLDKAVSGADVVFATNQHKPRQSLAYRAAHFAFDLLYHWSNGIHLSEEAPQYRVISRRVVNFILQHPHPGLTYRHLPATSGFARANLNYTATPRMAQTKRLGDNIERGVRQLVSTTRTPMRLVTSLTIFGALANVFYSVYVLAIAWLKVDVAAGWVSLSLQQSGMFFLLSLVLLVLGEYILHMASLSNEGPQYHVAQEMTSARMTRRHKLNIEVVNAGGAPAARQTSAAGPDVAPPG